MDQLIKLVRTYRVTTGLADRLRLAEDIFRHIQPELWGFVLGSIRPPAAEDVFQEILKAIATSLGKFTGGTPEEFWGWCYRIARNKLNDHYRAKATDRMQTTDPVELWHMMELSAQAAPMTAQTKHDLAYAIDLLTKAKPECADLLWRHYVTGLDYGEIAEENHLKYDTVRMRIGRCLDEAKALVS